MKFKARVSIMGGRAIIYVPKAYLEDVRPIAKSKKYVIVEFKEE
ncbi:MAG TPA: hypothetical protein VL854_05980 [Nitrososphaeraceae archaeon]|nr:hypothetical protein [Nitrososphaeraceae archaeon]